MRNPILGALGISCLMALLALPASAVSIDWVAVGDPGNPCDPQLEGCFGSVDYAYQISKYEITNAQYAEFLNAVADTDTYDLYNTDMGLPGYPRWGGITRSGSSGSYTYSTIPGRENMPVGSVSFWDALRFANWLHNGQPTGAQGSGTTETGAYTITAEGMASNSITRNSDATIVLTSEDEWYKAAYYDASTTSYNPYPFADGFDGGVCDAPPGTTSHSANCNEGDLTDVGAYTGSPSAYATFDQGGNSDEWNDTIIRSDTRGVRGGNFMFDYPEAMAAVDRQPYWGPSAEEGSLGFRVAMIPEPTTALLLGAGLAGLAAAGRRRSPY